MSTKGSKAFFKVTEHSFIHSLLSSSFNTILLISNNPSNITGKEREWKEDKILDIEEVRRTFLGTFGHFPSTPYQSESIGNYIKKPVESLGLFNTKI